MAAATRVYVFLRAINIGSRRLSNDELIAPFVGAGFEDVAAYQAAGNIVFRVVEPGDRERGDRAASIADATLEATADSIAPVLLAAYGFEAAVFVRSGTELRAVVDARPFTTDELATSEGRVQVAFLGAEPDAATVSAVAEIVPADDRVVVSGTELFWLPRAGVGTSQLPVGRIEQLLGPMTIRTLGTVERMLAKFGE